MAVFLAVFMSRKVAIGIQQFDELIEKNSEGAYSKGRKGHSGRKP